MKGKLIIFEGPDGSGKSTQAKLYCSYLKERGLDPLLLREPGGTAVGERIREILLDPASGEMDARSELLLYMAARSLLCVQVIHPALVQGKIVVCDRFLLSSAVYQGWAGGLGMDRVFEIGEFAVQGARPHRIVVLDIDHEKGFDRIQGGLDRMELKEMDYHRKVREGYLAYARENPDTVRVIDADGTIEQVHGRVLEALKDVL
jgi:dTMP kinase